MNTIFEAHSLERNYRFLDELPESLYPVVVTHTQGLLPQRVQGIMAHGEKHCLRVICPMTSR